VGINTAGKRKKMPYTYITKQDLIDRHGEEKLAIIAGDENGEIKQDIVDAAIDDASDEITGYISSRYALPFSIVPRMLERIAVDVSIYRMASDADTGSEEIRKRYEDAVKALEKIRDGKIMLEAQQKETEENEAEMPILFQTSQPLFARKNMQKVF
jgi:phage gp36-like protein